MAKNWQRFHWDLDKSLDDLRPDLPPFVLRAAEAEDRETALKVVSSALLMERAWTGTATAFARGLEKRCEEAFDEKTPACVVVQHGSRIIGASLLDLAVDADIHLLTGPCILHEYRGRGLGSGLLHQSLARLRDKGLRRVVAMARVNSTTARYIYPKFGGIAEPVSAPKIAA